MGKWLVAANSRNVLAQIGLFGSYGWGDGEWMRNWEADCKAAGAEMPADFVICNDAPDADAVEACKALGAALA